MSKLPQVPVASGAVLSALQAGPFRAPAHAWLFEVRNGTGFARSQLRTADAIVMSCWPSRGLWVGGVEVKVRRNDWLRELDQPDKSHDIQRFCDYWWLAAPAGVVELAEVPERWGYYELVGRRCRLRREAPKLAAEALDRVFLASLLRNQAEQVAAAHVRGRQEADREHEAAHGDGAAARLQEELNAAYHKLERLTQDHHALGSNLTCLEEAVLAFETAVGMEAGGVRFHKRTGADRAYKAAQLLATIDPADLAAALREAATALVPLTLVPAELQTTQARRFR